MKVNHHLQRKEGGAKGRKDPNVLQEFLMLYNQPNIGPKSLGYRFLSIHSAAVKFASDITDLYANMCSIHIRLGSYHMMHYIRLCIYRTVLKTAEKVYAGSWFSSALASLLQMVHLLV